MYSYSFAHWGCIYQCKDTNFKANHNILGALPHLVEVVFTNAKILILKLITTYQKAWLSHDSCIYQCKDTNFKANHNREKVRQQFVTLYLPMQRY